MNTPAASLADQPLGHEVRIIAVDWDALAQDEARRLQALGIDCGAVVRIAHRGFLAGKDPLALEIGRMTVAVRRSHALAISVVPADGEMVHPVGAAAGNPIA